MDKEQKLFKGLILADLKIVSEHWDDENKAMRLQAAYHTQQAIEKTIKLKAEIEGLNLWGHDIGHLIKNIAKTTLNNFGELSGWLFAIPYKRQPTLWAVVLSIHYIIFF